MNFESMFDLQEGCVHEDSFETSRGSQRAMASRKLQHINSTKSLMYVQRLFFKAYQNSSSLPCEGSLLPYPLFRYAFKKGVVC